MRASDGIKLMCHADDYFTRRVDYGLFAVHSNFFVCAQLGSLQNSLFYNDILYYIQKHP